MSIYRRTQTPGSTGIILCASGQPQPREPCPNALHSHPLYVNYEWAAEEAERRLAAGWLNEQCPDCGLYGWRKPQSPNPVHHP